MINPEEIPTALEWTDRMAEYLPNILPMKIFTEDQWKDWAYYVVRDSSISRFNPPDPSQFSDWREWAYRFNDTVQLD